MNQPPYQFISRFAACLSFLLSIPLTTLGVAQVNGEFNHPGAARGLRIEVLIENGTPPRYVNVTLVPPAHIFPQTETSSSVSALTPPPASDSAFEIIHDTSVMQDLEVIDSQKQTLERMRKEYGQKIRELSQQYGKASSDPKRFQEIFNQISELQTSKRKSYSDILLPHQRNRLSQIWNQKKIMMQGGAEAALQRGSIAKRLNMTDEQKSRLAAIEKELRKDIAEQTKKLRKAAEEKAMQVLTKEQLAKFKTITGEKFSTRDRDDSDLFIQDTRQNAYGK